MEEEQTKSLRDIDLVKVLRTISTYYYLLNDVGRRAAYTKASSNIEAYPEEIISGEQVRENIKNIGPSIQQDINEFITTYNPVTRTGTITRLEQLKERLPQVWETISYYDSLFGIGFKTALNFYEKGYRTLSDLWNSNDLTKQQRLGILWRKHIPLRIDRSEMNQINTLINSLLTPKNIKWDMTGSYRRGESTSGDIDLLVQSNNNINMDIIFELFGKYIVDSFNNGNNMRMAMFRLSLNYNAHRIDVRLIEPNSYPFALLYFTGSQRFNILLRSRARQFGYLLNEHGLSDANGNKFNATSEEDIFRVLGVAYLTPELRTMQLENLPLLNY